MIDCCCSKASKSTNVVLSIDTYGRNNNVLIFHQRGSENIPPDGIRSCTVVYGHRESHICGGATGRDTVRMLDWK